MTCPACNGHRYIAGIDCRACNATGKLSGRALERYREVEELKRVWGAAPGKPDPVEPTTPGGFVARAIEQSKSRG